MPSPTSMLHTLIHTSNISRLRLGMKPKAKTMCSLFLGKWDIVYIGWFAAHPKYLLLFPQPQCRQTFAIFKHFSSGIGFLDSKSKALMKEQWQHIFFFSPTSTMTATATFKYDFKLCPIWRKSIWLLDSVKHIQFPFFLFRTFEPQSQEILGWPPPFSSCIEKLTLRTGGRVSLFQVGLRSGTYLVKHSGSPCPAWSEVLTNPEVWLWWRQSPGVGLAGHPPL